MYCLSEFHSLSHFSLAVMINTHEIDESGLGQIRNAYKIFVRKFQLERVLGRCGRFEDNVKLGVR
jgi:hypothetical protein